MKLIDCDSHGFWLDVLNLEGIKPQDMLLQENNQQCDDALFLWSWSFSFNILKSFIALTLQQVDNDCDSA